MLFISHAQADTQTARRLAQVFRSAGQESWLEPPLAPEGNWRSRILNAIQRADALVYVITRRSVNSEQCHWEFSIAEGLGKPVIPVVVEDVEVPADLRYYPLVSLKSSEDWQAIPDVIRDVSQFTPPKPADAVSPIPMTLPEGAEALPMKLSNTKVSREAVESVRAARGEHLVWSLIGAVASAAALLLVATGGRALLAPLLPDGGALTLALSLIALVVVAAVWYTVQFIYRGRYEKRLNTAIDSLMAHDAEHGRG